MSNKTKHFFYTQGFRISVIALLAVALMAGAAFWFGTGLRADTSQSVARSPQGSSLTAIRESRLDDYYGRLSNSSAAAASRWAAVAARDKSWAVFYMGVNATNAAADAARSASLAALANSRAGLYAQLNNSSAATRAAALAALANSTSAFFGELSNSSAADSYQNAWMGFTAPESVGARPSATNHPWIKPEGIKSSEAADSAADQYSWIKPEGISLSTP